MWERHPRGHPRPDEPGELRLFSSLRGKTMDVILSWSGDLSRKVAESLNGWLKDVLPGIKPWISTEDITKGSTWFPALLGRLEAARLCILCITPENVRSPWLYFEAGAIAG